MYIQTVRRNQKRKPTGVRNRASNWYRWLWLSPVLTIPTLIFLMIQVESLLYGLNFLDEDLNFSYELYFTLSALFGILGSSLWHLLLLIPSLDRKSEFVRWHGRQMFILAGIRTVAPLILVLIIEDEMGFLVSIPVLIIIWLVGNLWGQQQAKRGDCSLMRRKGKGELLPGPEIDNKEKDEKEITKLLTAIRFGKDPQERSIALVELQKRGLVEEF